MQKHRTKLRGAGFSRLVRAACVVVHVTCVFLSFRLEREPERAARRTCRRELRGSGWGEAERAHLCVSHFQGCFKFARIARKKYVSQVMVLKYITCCSSRPTWQDMVARVHTTSTTHYPARPEPGPTQRNAACRRPPRRHARAPPPPPLVGEEGALRAGEAPGYLITQLRLR